MLGMGLARHPFGRGYTTALPNRSSGVSHGEKFFHRLEGESRPMRLFPPHDAKQRLRKPPDQPEQTANDKERQLPFILHAPGLRPGCRGVVLAVYLARTSWGRGSCVSHGERSFRRRGVTVQPVCSLLRLLGMPTTLVYLANGWIQPVSQPIP